MTAPKTLLIKPGLCFHGLQLHFFRDHNVGKFKTQGTQNYLPPPPESKIELWVAKSTVGTGNPGKHRKIISTIAFAGSAKIWAARWWQIVLSC